MSKRNKIRSGLLLLLLVVGMLCGCNRYSVPKPETQKSSSGGTEESPEDEEAQDVFAEAEDESQATFNFGHGAKNPNLNERDEIAPFEYTGGEFSMEYTFDGAGNGREITVGFLVFVNGMPQPYRVDDSKKEEYCHIFPVEQDNEDVDFTMYFTPVSGKKGEMIEIVVAGLLHPAYQPDMNKTSGWGVYHNMLPSAFRLDMKANPPAHTQPATSEHPVENVKQDRRKITGTYVKEELTRQGYTDVTTDMLEKNAYYSTTYDGKECMDYLDVSGKKKVHITHQLFGCSGHSYSTTVFLNHQPVSDTMRVTLAKGELVSLEMDLDVESIKEDSTVYIVTVPDETGRNAIDTGTALDAYKTFSILLYHKGEKAQATARPTQVSAQDTVGLNDVKGKILEAFYGEDANLVIRTEKELCLYDTRSQTVKAGMNVPNWHDFTVRSWKDGYVLVGNASASAQTKANGGIFDANDANSSKWRALYLDMQLQKTKQVNLTGLLGKNSSILSSEDIVVSSNGRKIAAITDDGIVLCDVRSGKRRRLLDARKDKVINHFELSGMIGQIAFTADNQKLAFLSGALPENASDGEYMAAWGTLSLKGREWHLMTDASYDAQELFVYGNRFVLPEGVEHASGRLLKVDMASGKKSFLSFSDKKEGKDGVSVSEAGHYFATACLADKSVTVRVYDMETGRLLKEKTIRDKKEDYFYRCPNIYLMDGTKSCIVILGGGIREVATKVEQFTFS